MLAECRKLVAPTGDFVNTPLLLPSFSSKGFPQIKKTIKLLDEHLIGPVLISAFDIHHKFIPPRLTFPNPILFIDSGGYEASSEVDFLDEENFCYHPKKWTEQSYDSTIISLLKEKTAKAIVSFDSPGRRLPFKKQIVEANKKFEKFFKFGKFLREFLIKPVSKNIQKQYLDIEQIISNFTMLKDFEIIGVTEKELGKSLLERMCNIMQLKRVLKEKGMNQFIHIFGSLDPISTPLYFLCGADIFDGLTWLRYAYLNGTAVYQRNYWALSYSLDKEDLRATLNTFIHNHDYLKQFAIEMKSFQKTADFKLFSHNSELIRRLWDSAKGQMGGNV